MKSTSTPPPIASLEPADVRTETQEAFLRMVSDYLPDTWEEAEVQASQLYKRFDRVATTVTIRARVSLTGRVAKVDGGRIAFTSCAVGSLNEMKQVSTYETHLPRFERNLDQPELGI